MTENGAKECIRCTHLFECKTKKENKGGCINYKPHKEKNNDRK